MEWLQKLAALASAKTKPGIDFARGQIEGLSTTGGRRVCALAFVTGKKLGRDWQPWQGELITLYYGNPKNESEKTKQATVEDSYLFSYYKRRHAVEQDRRRGFGSNRVEGEQLGSRASGIGLCGGAGRVLDSNRDSPTY